MTHIRDPIQELLIIVRRNQIHDAATNLFAEWGDHSTPGQTDCLEWSRE